MLMELMDQALEEKYSSYLKAMGALSKLFSESSNPYLGYRAVENIFCLSFEAENLSRSDCSVDAKKDFTGIGVKTFLNGNGKTLQKIAEFNSDLHLYREKDQDEEIVKIISDLRNKRLDWTKRTYGLNNMIYHCVVRDTARIMVFETSMDNINISAIKNIKGTKSTIKFEDDKNEYSFNRSKSTLYKRFYTSNVLLEIDVKIIDNPYKEIIKLISNEFNNELIFSEVKKDKEYVILPLFSDKGERHVPKKSGLNQWNAGGRKRNYNEVYIPIPVWIRKTFVDFFPAKNRAFELKLPDAKVLSAKACQQNRKALMSNPNADLGKWLYRKVMNLEKGELLTYKKLEELGLDSVILYKEGLNKYSIDFSKIGSYDEFVEENK